MRDTCICLDMDDGLRPACSQTKVVTARKDHVCGECLEPIAKGTMHEVCWGLWGPRGEQRAHTYRTCMTCRAIRNTYFQCGWFFGEVWDRIHEHLCDGDMTEPGFCICPPKRRMKVWNPHT